MRAILAALLVAVATPAVADVAVRYDSAREISPLVYRSAGERDALFAEIARLLKRLGERDLPAGRSLKIELIDIRPAGMFQPWRPTADKVRVLTGVTPPQVKLRYALTERGRVVARGEETVTDLNYQQNLGARASIGSFPYERELIRDWFRDRIIRGRPARG